MLVSFHASYTCGGPYSYGNLSETCTIHKAILQMLETVKGKIPTIFVTVGSYKNFMIYFMY